MLFKPKWEHKDPRVRARAAAEIDDPRLIEVLPELAASDPDPAVRLQAARRVTDVVEIRRLAEQADDSAVRDFARRTLRAMLAGTHEPPVPLATRLELLREIDEADLIEHLAREGVEPDLRRAALERVTRPALLGDVALGDAEPELRQLAASRIESASTLDRVAGKSRKTDKKVYKVVTERLTRLRLDAGDPAELEKQTGELCQALERLAREDSSREHKQAELERLQARWAALGPAPAELTARFVGARRILEAALAGAGDRESGQQAEIEHYLAECKALLGGNDLDLLQRSIERGEALRRDLAPREPAVEARLETALAELAQARERLLAEQPPAPQLLAVCRRAEKLDPVRVRPKQLEQLRSSWDKAWAELAEHRPADQSLGRRVGAALTRLEEALAQRAERRREALARLDETLDALEARLEDGDLAGAVKRKSQLLDDLALIGSAPQVNNPDFKGRVNVARRRLYELRDWQHWANNKIRTRLCEEAEAIAGSGMHPDAVAEKVKELNAQWRELEDSEHLPGDDPNRPASPGLRRRFQGACNRAFLPAKDYFKKRAEIREKHLHELDAVCAELEATAADPQQKEFRELERLVARGRRSLRKLGKIPPRERSAMSKRLREAADALDQRLDAHYQIVERKKRRLIEEVGALAEESDLGQAVNAAKDAQRRWREAGHCRRRLEQKLWTEFRAACDRIFERLDEQRSERRAERQAHSQALRELLTAARRLRDAGPDELENADRELSRLQQQWREAGARDRRAESEFYGLVRDIERAWARERERRRAERRRHWRELALSCQELEQELGAGREPARDELGERWKGLSADAPAALVQRVGRLLEAAPGDDSLGPDATAANLDRALGLCLRMEFLAGVETPAKHRAARMDFQVRRLAERMSGAELPAPRDEAAEIESDWLGCGPLPPAEAGAVNERFLRALKAFGER